MFSRIRKRFSYVNVAMTLALVLAMSGGAYAAKRYLINSTKDINPKVLKQLTGKNGKNGTNGAQGVPGPSGSPGTGTAGKDGTAGASVVSSSEPGGPASHCTSGGSKFVVGASTTYACNGQTGFTETLPPGKTETGVWGFDSQVEAIVVERFSFPIPLKEAPEAIYLIKPGEEGKEEPVACPGTLEVPKAAPGVLCIYSERLVAPDLHNHTLLATGALAVFFVTKTQAETFLGAIDKGTWAVTEKEG